MISIESNGFFIFCVNFNRERLTILIGEVYLLSYSKILSTRKLFDLKCKNRIRIRHTVSFLRHQMNIYHLANLHVCNCRIKAFDHLSCSADEFQWLATVIGRIELCSVIKGSSVMCTAGFSDIRTCDRWLGTASAATASAGMSVFMTAAGVSILMASAGMSILMMVMITVHTCGYQLALQISIHSRIYVTLCSGT